MGRKGFVYHKIVEVEVIVIVFPFFSLELIPFNLFVQRHRTPEIRASQSPKLASILGLHIAKQKYNDSMLNR